MLNRSTLGLDQLHLLTRSTLGLDRLRPQRSLYHLLLFRSIPKLLNQLTSSPHSLVPTILPSRSTTPQVQFPSLSSITSGLLSPVPKFRNLLSKTFGLRSPGPKFPSLSSRISGMGRPSPKQKPRSPSLSRSLNLRRFFSRSSRRRHNNFTAGKLMGVTRFGAPLKS